MLYSNLSTNGQLIIFGSNTIDNICFRDNNVYPRVNLMNIFNLVFPVKSETLVETYLTECGICYSHIIDIIMTNNETKQVTPRERCLSKKCNRMYHTSCLYEWLQSLPDSKNSFGTTYGLCPYCRENISIRLN